MPTKRISIHALLAESDPMDEPQYQILDISIHALLAESDSTRQVKQTYRENFYPRSPCGERQATNGLADTPPKISIHALLAESDFSLILTGFTGG